jgi:anaerobic selenocysteine-containing dehydrogenase
MREAISFCRLCPGACGLVVKIDDAGVVATVNADRKNAASRGYICPKGVQSAEMHRRPDRISRPQKRGPDGSVQSVRSAAALDDIASRLRALIAEHGPESVACYLGTPAYFNVATFAMGPAFLQAIGSPSLFSALTIDNSAKIVNLARMGVWGAGKHGWNDSDVWVMFGSNPLVSITGVSGLPTTHADKTLREGKARGLKLVSIDPRRSETARHADLFLPIRPGEDSAVAAAMLRLILAEGLHDQSFCAAYVEDLDALRAAVEPFTLEYAAARAGLPAADIEQAARLLAAGPRGCAALGTGVTMSPFPNLAVHLIEALNVVLGRFLREGERVANPVVLAPPKPFRAQVTRPARSWETGHRLRTGGWGVLQSELGAELPCAALADEITTPGKGQIRALLVLGGNPATAFPNQERTLAALRSLDLLVTVDPFWSTTAKIAHYVLPPRLMFERPDVHMLKGLGARTPIPFGHYTPAMADPPAGSDLVEDWEVVWELARRLELTLALNGRPMDMARRPTTDEVLELCAAGSRVALEEVRRHPHGKVFDVTEIVQPADAGGGARFATMPADVAKELTDYLAAAPGAPGPGYTHLLTVRRMREMVNSLKVAPEKVDRRTPYNPAYMHSRELAGLGVAPGERVEIISDAGAIVAVAEIDDDLREGVVSMTHGWGGLPDERGDGDGACTALLVSDTQSLAEISAMPRQSSIPVRVKSLGAGAAPRLESAV